jgi:hypothetical protein
MRLRRACQCFLSVVAFSIASLAYGEVREGGLVIAKKEMKSSFPWKIIKVAPVLNEAIWLDFYQSFTSFVIAPHQEYTVTDVVSAFGRRNISIRPGDRLVNFAGDINGVCTTNPVRLQPKFSMSSVPRSDNACYLDTDDDGSFDQAFGWPGGLTGSIVIPKYRAAIKAFTVVKIPDADRSIFQDIYLQYDFVEAFSSKMRFSYCAMPNVDQNFQKSPRCFIANLGIGKSLPVEFEVFGGKFILKQVIGKRVEIAQISLIEKIPFVLK